MYFYTTFQWTWRGLFLCTVEYRKYWMDVESRSRQKTETVLPLSHIAYVRVTHGWHMWQIFFRLQNKPPPHTNAGGEMLRKVHFSDSGNGEWRRRRPTQTIHSQLSGFHFYNFLQQIWTRGPGDIIRDKLLKKEQHKMSKEHLVKN